MITSIKGTTKINLEAAIAEVERERRKCPHSYLNLNRA